MKHESVDDSRNGLDARDLLRRDLRAVHPLGVALARPPRAGSALLEGILPGFTWLTPGSVILGLVEAFFYGMYIALVFVPLFNYFEGGRSGERATLAPSRETFDREAVTRG